MLAQDSARFCRGHARRELPPEPARLASHSSLSSSLTLFNRRRLALAKHLPWHDVVRVSRRAVGFDDWSSNRTKRTVGGHRAAQDIRELRDLLEAWRDARRTAWQPTVKVVTTGILAALLVAAAIKLKLM